MRKIASDSRDHGAADPSTFILPATTQRLLGANDGESVRLYRVTFEEGARTHWHTHDRAQMLFGLSGQCIVVDRAGVELLLGEGDLVVVEAGEEHWHGAAPGGPGAHLAINLGSRTVWMDSSLGD